jgi:hypothetical protein
MDYQSIKNIKVFLILNIVIFIHFVGTSAAQNPPSLLTVVEGYVVDSLQGDTIPFANISVAGTTIGVSADENGYFKLSFSEAKNQLNITAVGYTNHVENIKIGESQRLNIRLVNSSTELQTVVIKKERYRNKNNAAVELINKVIAHKSSNRLENHEYYQYKQYEKLELDLENVSDKLLNNKRLANVNFFFADVDTSKSSGKALIPAYIRETASSVYYRKSPNSRKEYVEGVQSANLGTLFDEKGMSQYMAHMYLKADIYDNEILMFKKPFLSPLSPLSPAFYRFYIMDTVVVKGKKCIDLAFFGRSKTDLTFEGHLFITDDSTYAVAKVDMTVPKHININYLKSMQLSQQFIQLPDASWTMSENTVAIDFGVGDNEKGMGFWGKKTTLMTDFEFNKPQESSIYAGAEKLIEATNSTQQPADFWEKSRQAPLSNSEQNIYKKAEKLMETPDYQNFLGFKYLWATGYYKQKGVEFGPFGALYSNNGLEGSRLRLGMRTTYDWSHHWRVDGYAAYGVKDQQWKYSAALSYQFNEQPFNTRPQSVLKAWYFKDVEVPGQTVENMSSDDILASFSRGVFDKMYYKQSFGLRYTNENKTGFSYQVGVQQKQLTPAGSLRFERASTDSNPLSITRLTANEAFVNLRYAPNEEYFQGQTNRRRIANKYPVFGVHYTYGNNTDTGGGASQSHTVSADVFKRFFIAPIGHTDIKLEAGRAFGQNLSYPSLQVMSANQTLNYEQFAFNQMNYLEFISDKYASLNVEHVFDGFFLNKIPLLKKLKWREVASFKAVYGGLDAANNPATNPSLFRFPTDANGQSLTSNFTANKPYMEAGFGITNIFKVLNINVTRRINYLDNPNTSKWRVQGEVLFNF